MKLSVLKQRTFMLMLTATVLLSGCSHAADDASRKGKAWSVDALEEAMRKLEPLATKLGKPRSGDWLARHKEPGQTFREYLRCDPVIPDKKRRVIVIQPLGTFTAIQRRIVTDTADFMGRYYNMTVRIEKDLPLSVIPAKARRTHPVWGGRQILSTYVLDKVLKPRLPKDAFAYIAFTASDLWPGRGWNFVFGQASLRERVGVWSIHRYGDPSKSDEAYRLALRRAMQTGTHELGHMMSMLHCTAYECNMCGSNNLAESDRRPIVLCPECVAKVCWATRADPFARYKRLLDFCEKHGLKPQAKMYGQRIEALIAK